MSGPITRQYGVPNWDEIFGKKDEKDAAPKERQPDPEQAANEKTPPADSAVSNPVNVVFAVVS